MCHRDGTERDRDDLEVATDVRSSTHPSRSAVPLAHPSHSVFPKTQQRPSINLKRILDPVCPQRGPGRHYNLRPLGHLNRPNRHRLPRRTMCVSSIFPRVPPLSNVKLCANLNHAHINVAHPNSHHAVRVRPAGPTICLHRLRGGLGRRIITGSPRARICRNIASLGAGAGQGGLRGRRTERRSVGEDGG